MQHRIASHPSLRRTSLVIALCSALLGFVLPSAAAAAEATKRSRAVDVVVILDTSGSMQGLLDSVRARIWDVVNELGQLQPTPELRVGLLTFGSSHGTETDGWIVEQSALTSELDQVYGKLMEVRIGGSKERVGHALDTAIERMNWRPELDALKLIFVAGNESADQGIEQYDFREVSRYAAHNGIVINALYAGTREDAVTDGWPEVAQHGKGNFSAIDVSLAQLQIATPQDEDLLKLNEALNATYLPYGENGEDGLANQVAQDRGASRLGVESCSSRIVTKGGALYDNASWDLVDATLTEDFNWTHLAVSELPEAMRDMSHKERVAFVEKHRSEREELQTRIQQLAQQREDFLLAARAESTAGLGAAMLEAIRNQATAKGFNCDAC